MEKAYSRAQGLDKHLKKHADKNGVVVVGVRYYRICRWVRNVTPHRADDLPSTSKEKFPTKHIEEGSAWMNIL